MEVEVVGKLFWTSKHYTVVCSGYGPCFKLLFMLVKPVISGTDIASVRNTHSHGTSQAVDL